MCRSNLFRITKLLHNSRKSIERGKSFSFVHIPTILSFYSEIDIVAISNEFVAISCSHAKQNTLRVCSQGFGMIFDQSSQRNGAARGFSLGQKRFIGIHFDNDDLHSAGPSN